jgi:hypothetical protein
MRTLTLSVLERLQLPELLPRAGKIIEMELARSIIDKVRLEASEIGEYGIRDTTDGRITWDQAKARDKDIEMEESEIKMLQSAIRNIDKEGKVTLESLPLVKKLLEIES